MAALRLRWEMARGGGKLILLPLHGGGWPFSLRNRTAMKNHLVEGLLTGQLSEHRPGA